MLDEGGKGGRGDPTLCGKMLVQFANFNIDHRVEVQIHKNYFTLTHFIS